MQIRWLRPALVLVPGAALIAVIATGVGAPWRTILALWFVIVCPGASLVGVLGVRDRFVELVVIAPLSMTLVTLTSVALFYGGIWSPDVEFALLLGLCLVGLGLSQLGSVYEVKGDA
ncbi:MAG TPA: hypothetical protein VIV12_18860 [Streptosporangiaceae bacterium]